VRHGLPRRRASVRQARSGVRCRGRRRQSTRAGSPKRSNPPWPASRRRPRRGSAPSARARPARPSAR
jgi:hypothetical protein